MKIILTNGTELSPIVVTGGKRYLGGVQRDALSFIFAEDASLDELDAIFTDANCETVKIEEPTTDAEGNEVVNEYIHTGYTIRAELKREPMEVTPATESSAAVYENRVTVTMAQRTYEEKQIQSMQASMNALLRGEE